MSRHDAEPASSDGRLQRSERSRRRIADALYELVGEGDPAPSAQRVADRARVGIRSVFRLFSDMDALYATLDERLAMEVAPLMRDMPGHDAPLDERIEAMIGLRTRIYERFGPYMRATRRHRHRSDDLAARSRKHALEARQRMARWVPELRNAASELVEAFDMATSLEAWDRLRLDQRLSRPRARATMLLVARALASRLGDPS